jgi:LmbE family N-acetylglucosaminyl deacetylase
MSILDDAAALTVLSPHFDDAVLSCGGTMWEARARGLPVRVLTLFAGAPPPEVPPFARVQHEMWGNPPQPNRLRRAEDVAACAALGCHDLHHLPAPDAVYRVDERGVALYGSEDAIFGPVHPQEAGYVSRLLAWVRPLLLEGGTTLAPLAVGNHVDHQLAHMVGRMLLNDGYGVVFYEELPYVERSDVLRHISQTGMEGEASLTLFSEEAMAHKVAAMAYYRTQVPVLYGDNLNMSRRIRAIAARVAPNGYAERSWRMNHG